MTSSDSYEDSLAGSDMEPLIKGSAPISIREVSELRASIPYLLGFYPERSLVLIGLAEEGTVVVTIRVDAPMSVQETHRMVEHLRPVLRRAAPKRLVVAYCDDYELATDDAIEAQHRRFSARRAFETVSELGPVIEAALEAEGLSCGFLWPANPGEPRPALGPVPQIAVAQALAGRTLLRNRDELYRQLEPVGGPARRSVRQQLEQLRQVGLDSLELIDVVAQILARGAGDTYGQGQAPLDSSEIAWCALAVADTDARDRLITWIAQDQRWWRIDPWCRVAQLAPAVYRAPALTVVAIIAYLTGDGALAQCALEQALTQEPNYLLATMIDTGLRAGLHPGELRRALASTFDDIETH